MKVPVAIIGATESVSERHILGYSRIPGMEVVALADADTEAAHSLAKKFGIKNVYDEYEMMLKKQRPDVVSVCTAPSEHKDAALSALSRGAHVLCELPMARNAEEGKAMLDAAGEANRVLVFAAPRRFEAQATTVREAVINRDLGSVTYSRAWDRRGGIPGEHLWQLKKNEGGGALSISGQNLLDLGLWMMGDEPISVSGRLFHRFPTSPDIPKTWFGSRREMDAEDLAVAMVRCKNSLLNLEIDWLCLEEGCGVTVIGTKGRGTTSPFQMEVANHGKLMDMTPTFLPETRAWDEQMGAFVDATLGHRKAFPDAGDILLVQKICDAIHKSSELGREVLLSEI
jgi:predicted dehydrogenase